MTLNITRSVKQMVAEANEHVEEISIADALPLVGRDDVLFIDIRDIREVAKTGRLITVEENPRLCGWGAEISSIVAEEMFYDLDGPILRITTPHIPLPAADALEDATMPSAERIVREIVENID